MKIVYDCHFKEVRGYPVVNYCFRRGEDAFLMWQGFFNDVMQAMWIVYGWDPDPTTSESSKVEQVPLLREWDEGFIGSFSAFTITDVGITAQAMRAAVEELLRAGSTLPNSVAHAEALALFFDEAARIQTPVLIEEW